MASTRWKGGAAPAIQVTTVQVTAYHASTTYTLTVGTKSVSTIAAGSVNATATALAAAWNLSEEQEFAEITASAATDTVTLTADDADDEGKPFTVTPSVSGGTGTLGAATTTTAATGPYHWDQALNWSGGAVPANGDDVYLELSAVPVKYGLAQSAVTLASLNIAASYTGEIGLPEVNADGSTSYLEYRARYLAIGATLQNVGTGEGQGSQRIMIDNGSVATALNVRQTGISREEGLPALLWKGTDATNVVNVTRGQVGLAQYGGEVATVATLTVGFVSSRETDAKVRGGAGLTLTTLSQSGGEVELNAGLTTVAKNGGTLTGNAGNVTTWTDDSGTSVYRGTGTVTTLNAGSSATVDFGQDMRARTVTNANLYRGCSVLDPFGTVVWTNAPRLVRCSLRDVTWDVGVHRTYAVT